MYNKDVNGIYYINANLPAAQTTFVGADNRPRWTEPTESHSHISNAIVLKNQNVGSSWNLAATLAKTSRVTDCRFRGAYSYGVPRTRSTPGRPPSARGPATRTRAIPNNPGVGYLDAFGASLGHRVFVQRSFTREYFSFGATSSRCSGKRANNGNTSYVFAGDMNGDGGSSNDLIYIPRDASEMNFATFTARAAAPSPPPSRRRRSRPTSSRTLIFASTAASTPSAARCSCRSSTGRPERHAGHVRRTSAAGATRSRSALDILNFGNLLNSNWGVGQRLIRNQILTNGGADAQGRATYRLAVVNNELLTTVVRDDRVLERRLSAS